MNNPTMRKPYEVSPEAKDFIKRQKAGYFDVPSQSQILTETEPFSEAQMNAMYSISKHMLLDEYQHQLD